MQTGQDVIFLRENFVPSKGKKQSVVYRSSASTERWQIWH